MLVTTSFDLKKKPKFLLLQLAIALCNFRLADLALLVPFLYPYMDFYELFLHYIEKSRLLTT